MEELAKLITALAALAWPLVFAYLVLRFYAPVSALIESARERKFSIKVAGNELTMEEASEQQRVLLTDLQTKVAELERRFSQDAPERAAAELPTMGGRRVLWVDDKPKNNSFLVAAMEERGVRVDTALSTEEGLARLRQDSYDLAISDMGRPEGDKAGIEFTRRLKALYPSTPVYIYCGKWAAANLREEALAAGVTEITSSGSSLLAEVIR